MNKNLHYNLLNRFSIENEGTERKNEGVGWDTSIPLALYLFLDERTSQTNIRNWEKFLPCGPAVKSIRNPLLSSLWSEWNVINILSPVKRMFCPVLLPQYLPTILPSLIISR